MLKRIPIVVACLLVLLGAGTVIPRPLWHAASANPDVAAGKYRIIVLSNPIHTDIAIPLDSAVLERFGFLAEAGMPIDHADVRYLIIGWGGRSFYLETPRWADLKPMPVFRALTIDASVMHVDLATKNLENSPDGVSFSIDAAAFEKLLAFVGSSFARRDSKYLPIAGAGYGKFDSFYEANGSFNALLGCNTWTAAALREAGLRTGLWNPLPNSLIWSLQLFNEH